MGIEEDIIKIHKRLDAIEKFLSTFINPLGMTFQPYEGCAHEWIDLHGTTMPMRQCVKCGVIEATQWNDKTKII